MKILIEKVPYTMVPSDLVIINYNNGATKQFMCTESDTERALLNLDTGTYYTKGTKYVEFEQFLDVLRDHEKGIKNIKVYKNEHCDIKVHHYY